MSALLELHGSREFREQPPVTPVKPLDEAVWQAWLAKNRAQEKRSSVMQMVAVKWVSIAALLAAAGMWSYLTPYELAVRFLVAVGAIVVMFQAFRSRRYAVAAVFGAVVSLYNPLAPVLPLSGSWQRAAVLASAIPFVATLLAQRKEGTQ